VQILENENAHDLKSEQAFRFSEIPHVQNLNPVEKHHEISSSD
jgi:hypothetical protein